MSASVLAPVTAIYEIAKQVKESIHRLDDPLTSRFYLESRKLQSQWRSFAHDDPHLAVNLDKLRWVTNVAVCTPLPLDNEGLNIICSARQLDGLLRQSLMAYPEFAESVNATVAALEKLISRKTSPVEDKIRELVASHDQVAIITGRERLNSSVQEHLQSVIARNDLRVIRASDLRKNDIYDVLIFTMPPNWIDPSVRNAVRAKRRDIVTMSAFQSDAAKKSVLPETWNPIVSIRRSTSATQTLQTLGDEESPLVLEDLEEAQRAEIDLMLARLTIQSHDDSSAESSTSLGNAEAILLANGSVVLLSAEGTIWTVEQDGQEFHVGHHKPTEVESGDYIVLRSKRDRDLIADIADQELGVMAPKLRSAQNQWKLLLRNAVRCRGLESVASELGQRGLGALATPSNVRRWMSDSFIRNQKYEHWMATMNYLGIGSYDATRLWTEMGKINDAHRQAGHIISGAIKSNLEAISLTNIRDSTPLPAMPELGEERLTMYLVQDRLGLIQDVRFTDMNRVLKW